MDGKTIVAVLIAGIGATLIDNLAAQVLFGLDFMLLPFILGAKRGAAA